MLNIAFDKNTGEIVGGKALELDAAKIEEEQKYDGYYSIVSRELELDDHELRDVYWGLGRIDDIFKVSKSDFEASPIYVWTNKHKVRRYVVLQLSGVACTTAKRHERADG